MLNIKSTAEELRKIIGNTPTLELGGDIYAKLEGENPAGSVKDRAALYIILKALREGLLFEGRTVVEATSGNTGIGLAYVAGKLGLKCVLTMPASMSEERKAMLTSYGAELVLTEPSLGMAGAVDEAKRICRERQGFFANQFGNTASVEAHFETTAPEIFTEIPDTRFVVAGVGSGGTVMGVKKYIEANGLDCKVVAVEPKQSPMLSEGRAGAHKIQGIGANFVPEILDKKKLDEILTVDDAEAVEAVGEIYRKFGVKCGISSGAAYIAAKALKAQIEKSTGAACGKIVAVFPDNGDRYPQSFYS